MGLHPRFDPTRALFFCRQAEREKELREKEERERSEREAREAAEQQARVESEAARRRMEEVRERQRREEEEFIAKRRAELMQTEYWQTRMRQIEIERAGAWMEDEDEEEGDSSASGEPAAAAANGTGSGSTGRSGSGSPGPRAEEFRLVAKERSRRLRPEDASAELSRSSSARDDSRRGGGKHGERAAGGAERREGPKGRTEGPMRERAGPGPKGAAAANGTRAGRGGDGTARREGEADSKPAGPPPPYLAAARAATASSHQEAERKEKETAAEKPAEDAAAAAAPARPAAEAAAPEASPAPAPASAAPESAPAGPSEAAPAAPSPAALLSQQPPPPQPMPGRLPGPHMMPGPAGPIPLLPGQPVLMMGPIPGAMMAPPPPPKGGRQVGPPPPPMFMAPMPPYPMAMMGAMGIPMGMPPAPGMVPGGPAGVPPPGAPGARPVMMMPPPPMPPHMAPPRMPPHPPMGPPMSPSRPPGDQVAVMSPERAAPAAGGQVDPSAASSGPKASKLKLRPTAAEWVPTHPKAEGAAASSAPDSDGLADEPGTPTLPDAAAGAADAGPGPMGREEGLVVQDVRGTKLRLRMARGLLNSDGAYNCFVNVVIQSLWHLPSFRGRLLAMSPADIGKKAQGAAAADVRVLRALCNIFRAFLHPGGDGSSPGDWNVDPVELREALSSLGRGSSFDLREMHDASEALSEIFNALHRAETGQMRPEDDPLLPHRAKVPVGQLPAPALQATGYSQVVQRRSLVQELFGLEVQTPVRSRDSAATTTGSGSASDWKMQPAGGRGSRAGSARDLAAAAVGAEGPSGEMEVQRFTKFFQLVPALLLRKAQEAFPGMRFDELLREVDSNPALERGLDRPGRGSNGATPASKEAATSLLRLPRVLSLMVVWDSFKSSAEVIRSLVSVGARSCPRAPPADPRTCPSPLTPVTGWHGGHRGRSVEGLRRGPVERPALPSQVRAVLHQQALHVVRPVRGGGQLASVR